VAPTSILTTPMLTFLTFLDLSVADVIVPSPYVGNPTRA